MDSVSQLLLSWGLGPQIIQKFIDEDITFPSFILLHEEAIARLIPKEGPRAIFSKLHSEWKQSSSSAGTSSSSNCASSAGTSSSSNCAGSAGTSSSSNCASSAGTSSSSNRASSAGTSSSFNCASSAPTGKRRLCESHVSEGFPPSKVTARSEQNFNKSLSKLSTQQCEPSINEVHKVLKGSIEGLTILAAYNTFGKLDHTYRDLLAKRVIFGEMQLDFQSTLNARITVRRLQELATLIEELFPTESAVTWCDVHFVRKKKIVTGRLKHKYYNIRRMLIKIGLLEKKQLQVELELDADIDDPAENDDENILWLKSHCEPWKLVLDKWEESLDVRKQLQKSQTPTEIINTYPALHKKYGWELLVADCEKAHPETSSDLLKTQWPKVLNYLESELKRKDKSFLTEQVPSAIREVEILCSVARVFKARNLPNSTKQKKTKQQPWRPTFQEVQDAFVFQIQDIAELRDYLDSRHNHLKSKGLTVQPFVVLVGPKSDIRQCLIVVDNQMWECESPRQAVEGCLKVFFGLDTEYPPEARHIWLFLQISLAGLETAVDYRGDPHLKSFLSSFIKDCRNFC